MKEILLNLDKEFPSLSYYQGMNYIAAYLFYKFEKDTQRAFQVFHWIIKNYLIKIFSTDLIGVLQLCFMLDKLLEIRAGLLWSRLSREGVGAIHFSISLILTLFTVYASKKELMPLIDRLFDIFLADGFEGSLRAILFLIESQQTQVLSQRPGVLLMKMKGIEESPFWMTVGTEDAPNPSMLPIKVKITTKTKINSVKIESGLYDFLCEYYKNIETRFAKFKQSSTI